MSRSRPTSNPVSYHRQTKQYYVTRGGKRIYLGADQEEAIRRYHQMGLGHGAGLVEVAPPICLTAKELANRFLAAQRANWRNPEATLKSYRDWLGRFLTDHPRLRVTDFTVEAFAAWKLSLRNRGYSAESINHYLTAVRGMFRFAEDTDLIAKAPKLRRVRNEPRQSGCEKLLYSPEDIQRLLGSADLQLKTMIMLALNCGFGPKDVHDLAWDHLAGDRIALPRSKTGVSQTYRLWPETFELLQYIRQCQVERNRKAVRSSVKIAFAGHVFITRFGRPWSKDAVAEQFRRLCKKANVTCHGFYRLRHCASTAVSLVANPHVQRRFMRHSKLQQQVTYTHIPDAEVDRAVMQAREKLLG
jgi:integrase